jgi:hypothetical protein
MGACSSSQSKHIAPPSLTPRASHRVFPVVSQEIGVKDSASPPADNISPQLSVQIPTESIALAQPLDNDPLSCLSEEVPFEGVLKNSQPASNATLRNSDSKAVVTLVSSLSAGDGNTSYYVPSRFDIPGIPLEKTVKNLAVSIRDSTYNGFSTSTSTKHNHMPPLSPTQSARNSTYRSKRMAGPAFPSSATDTVRSDNTLTDRSTSSKQLTRHGHVCLTVRSTGRSVQANAFVVSATGKVEFAFAGSELNLDSSLASVSKDTNSSVMVVSKE